MGGGYVAKLSPSGAARLPFDLLHHCSAMNNGGVRPCNLAFTQAACDPTEFTCHESVDSLKRARHVPMARPMLSIATGLSRAGARVPIILPTSLKRHEVSSVRHEGEELTHRPSSPAFGFEGNQLILNQFPQYLWDTHKRSTYPLSNLLRW
jgi:hypothetical protein